MERRAEGEGEGGQHSPPEEEREEGGGGGEEQTRVQTQRRVVLRLLPRNNDAASRVRAAGHNPWLELKLKPTRSVASVLRYLQQKWGVKTLGATPLGGQRDMDMVLHLVPVGERRPQHPGWSEEDISVTFDHVLVSQHHHPPPPPAGRRQQTAELQLQLEYYWSQHSVQLPPPSLGDDLPPPPSQQHGLLALPCADSSPLAAMPPPLLPAAPEAVAVAACVPHHPSPSPPPRNEACQLPSFSPLPTAHIQFPVTAQYPLYCPLTPGILPTPSVGYGPFPCSFSSASATGASTSPFSAGSRGGMASHVAEVPALFPDADSSPGLGLDLGLGFDGVGMEDILAETGLDASSLSYSYLGEEEGYPPQYPLSTGGADIGVDDSQWSSLPTSSLGMGV